MAPNTELFLDSRSTSVSVSISTYWYSIQYVYGFIFYNSFYKIFITAAATCASGFATIQADGSLSQGRTGLTMSRDINVTRSDSGIIVRRMAYWPTARTASRPCVYEFMHSKVPPHCTAHLPTAGLQMAYVPLHTPNPHPYSANPPCCLNPVEVSSNYEMAF